MEGGLRKRLGVDGHFTFEEGTATIDKTYVLLGFTRTVGEEI